MLPDPKTKWKRSGGGGNQTNSAQAEEWIMYDGCTMNLEINVLITQWVLSNMHLKQEFKILTREKDSQGNGNLWGIVNL